MRFSQRLGITNAIKVAQRESIDDDLRNSLWSLLTIYYWDSYKAAQYHAGEVSRSSIYPLIAALYLHYFKKPVDTIPSNWRKCLEGLRAYYFNAAWYEVYDFVEVVVDYGSEFTKAAFAKACNDYLTRENSAYRFVDGKITEITSQDRDSRDRRCARQFRGICRS